MMTRFEKARILGARALQISLGAPPGENVEHMDPIRIAETEMNMEKVPLTVKRRERS
jgi:DNA-directed RNA polymerase subunit K/omega